MKSTGETIWRTLRALATGRAGTWSAVLVFVAGITAVFAPAFFQGRYLATGDAVVFSIPAYYAEHGLWSNLVLMGFPTYATPGTQAFYPLSWLSLIPYSYNVFIMSAYVIAAFGTYGYVRAVTANHGAGIVGGFCYALGSFMVAHLGHVMMIHSVAWLPFVIWGIELLHRRDDARSAALVILGVAGLFLGGDPQHFILGATLGGCYFLFRLRGAAGGPIRFAVRSALGAVTGVAVCAVTLLPSMQLLHASPHKAATFTEFVSYAVPLAQFPVFLFFPYFFGESGTPVYPFGLGQEFGGNDFGWVELGQYSGILALALAAVAVATRSRTGHTWFWLGTAVVAAALAVGNDVGLASILYHVPILNLAPGPARNAMELNFAVAVLAGLGYGALAARAVSVRRATAAGGAVLGLMLLTLAGLFAARDVLRSMAAKKGLPELHVGLFQNSALLIPFLIALLSVAAVVLFARRPLAWSSRVAVAVALAADIWSFAGMAYWHAGVFVASLERPAYARDLGAELKRSGQRVLSPNGATTDFAQIPPNVSLLWDVPSVGGYEPLEDQRIVDFLQVFQTGQVVAFDLVRGRDAGLDLAATRYAILPPESRVTLPSEHPWSLQNLGLMASSTGAPGTSDRVGFGFPQAVPITRFGIVIQDLGTGPLDRSAPAAEVRVFETNGRSSVLALRAGRELTGTDSERPDVGPGPHAPPGPAADPGARYFVANVRLPRRTVVKSVELRWAQSRTVLLRHISVTDDMTDTAYPFTAYSEVYGPTSRWSFVRAGAGYTLLENRGAFPRAWAVGSVRALAPADALHAVERRRFDDGTPFDPAAVALSDDAVPVAGTGKGTAEVTALDDLRMTVRVACAAACFLVTSDAYYPGWHANVDGTPVDIHRADYALRGVAVPAGTHEVRFWYAPPLFYAGLVITALALVVTVLVAAAGHRLDSRLTKFWRQRAVRS